jgi:hypothetical protein
MYREGNDVKVFSGNAERNLSDIGAGGSGVSESQAVVNWLGVHTFTSNVNLNSNITFGDAISDNIIGVARIDMNWVPKTDSSKDLGSFGLNWKNVIADNFVINNTLSGLKANGNDLELEIMSGNNILITDNGTQFVRFDGGSNVSVFSRDITLDGMSRIRSFDSQEIGLFVTNHTGSIGTSGSNQMPADPDLQPSLSTLNNTFGSAIGCMGIFNTAKAFVNIAIKSRSSEWVVLAIPNSSGPVLGNHINS